MLRDVPAEEDGAESERVTLGGTAGLRPPHRAALGRGWATAYIYSPPPGSSSPSHSSLPLSDAAGPVPHHVQVWRPEGGGPELQTLLLQQLQSGKTVVVLAVAPGLDQDP